MITYHDLLAACTRAARYRRQLAIDAGEPEGNLAERITALPAAIPELVGNGWIRAGVVLDEVAGCILEVWVSTDGRVKVEQPPTVEVTEHQPESGDPIWYALWLGEGQARPGYIYTLNGRDYSPDEAAAIVTQRGHADGWSWRAGYNRGERSSGSRLRTKWGCLMPEWRNWQTRGAQTAVGVTLHAGSTPASGTIRRHEPERGPL